MTTGTIAKGNVDQQTTKAHKILIVEDEAVIAMDLEQRLANMGYEVVGIAASGERALALSRQHQPDLVLMDVMIKGPEDGVQTAQRIVAEQDVPVVFLTAYGDKTTLARAKESMPYGYLTKPFRPADLRTTIEVTLHKHAMDRRVRESEHWLRKTLRAIGEGIIATDPMGRVRFLNPVAETMLMLREADAIGRPIADVFRLEAEPGPEAPSDLVAQALHKRTQTSLVSGALVSRVASATPTFVDAGAAPICDDKDRVLGAVLVFRDVSQRRLAEHELHRHREHLEQLVRDRTQESERARRDAERASKAKSEFLSAMSHELRTPMNAILGFSQILETKPMDEEDAESVRHIYRAGQHLMRLIDDLLDMSRIEAGRMSVEICPVTVGTVCEQVMPMVTSLLQKYRVTMHYEGDPSVRVLADPARLRQVVLNLISNAIKYNRVGGRVVVRYEILPDARLRLSVQDTGLGIAPEKQAMLFRPFERLGVESTRIEGIGLGLAFSKRLVELMGGSLGLHSKRGEGSTFWVTLQLAASDHP